MVLWEYFGSLLQCSLRFGTSVLAPFCWELSADVCPLAACRKPTAAGGVCASTVAVQEECFCGEASFILEVAEMRWSSCCIAPTLPRVPFVIGRPRSAGGTGSVACHAGLGGVRSIEEVTQANFGGGQVAMQNPATLPCSLSSLRPLGDVQRCRELWDRKGVEKLV